MLLTILVGLYTSRVVLDALGVEDFGIYNVVGGLVSAFTLITNSLSGAITRFITFELGKKDMTRLKSVVSASFNIQLLISLIVIIVAETLGLWFLNHEMNIAGNRMVAANWVFQCTIFMFVVRLIMIPLNALIIAHERMDAFAYFSIIEVFLQLCVAFLLQRLVFDSLMLYGCLMSAIALIVFLMYWVYCKKKFVECVYQLKMDKAVGKDMMGFAGWNFVGTTSMVLRHQGIDIIVNIFFGVLLNAARGIATQVSSAAHRLVDSFTTALRPQIIKSYAAGDIERTKFLVNQCTRFSIYLVLCYTIPMILEMEAILSIWLKEVPEWARLFCQLQLLVALVSSFSSILMMVLLADRNIKNYQITVGLISICAFPLAYIMLVIGLPAYTTYFALMITEVFGFTARLYFTRKRINMSIRHFLFSIVGNILAVGIVAFIIPCIIVNTMESSFLRLCITTIVSIISIIVSVYFIGLSKSEKADVVYKLKNHVFKKRL